MLSLIHVTRLIGRYLAGELGAQEVEDQERVSKVL